MPIVEITDNVFGDDEPDQTPIVLICDSTTDSHASTMSLRGALVLSRSSLLVAATWLSS